MTETVRQILEAMKTADSLAEALDILVSRLSIELDVDACTVFVRDSDSDHYVMMASTIEDYGLILGHWSVVPGKGLIGQVAETGGVVHVSDLSSQKNKIEVPKGIKISKPKSFLGMPLLFHGQVLGVLALQDSEPHEFSEAERGLVLGVATQLASAVADAIETGRLSEYLSSYHQNRKTVRLSGMAASPGVAIGQTVVIYPPASFDSVTDKVTEDPEEDVSKFEEALRAVSADITKMDDRLAESLSQDERALFGAYLQIIESNSFKDAVIRRVRDGQWVQAALRDAVRDHVRMFEQMTDEYMRERADDVRDIGRRILAHLQANTTEAPKYPQNTVLVGRSITASMLAEVPRSRLKGIISATGSTNAHAAILAKALGVPAVMGVKHLPLKQADQRSVILDGYTGHLYLDPNPMLKQAYQRLATEEAELQTHLLELKDQPAETTDRIKIALRANAGLVADINPALAMSAEGIGLYRSEVPFMVLSRFPSEEEQRIIYRQLLSAFPDYPVVMRTLDVGGDKVLPYFVNEEDNPFLGWRGIRILLDHPEIFATQIRAMLRASDGLKNLHIMLPMISDVGEIEQSIEVIDKIYHQMIEDGLNLAYPHIGVMIEVPAAVYQIDRILDLVDFVSVGSNDLTQYLLAVDRNNNRVAKLYDTFHPSVLIALLTVVEAAKRKRKHVSLCGEFASDPLATVPLVGMGFDSLSMSANSILKVKWVLRGFTQSYCRSILMDIMAARNTQQIRAILQENLVEAGFGGLIRAGKY